MEKSHGFVRGSIYRSGVVFLESKRDRATLDVVQAVYTDLKGNVSQWVAVKGLKQRLMSLEHLKNYVSMKRVASQTFARQSQLMAPGKAKTCFVCVDDIGTFKRRYNCQKCGEVRHRRETASRERDNGTRLRSSMFLKHVVCCLISATLVAVNE